ncbi:MAG TPA: hypothetical protein VJZ49_04570 [Syntrophales bacterium]|nr:hypothetical protein [Syntrophales bacterium]
MGKRCLADVFMYCKGTPEPSSKPGYLGYLGCEKDPAKCGLQIGSKDLPGYKKPQEKERRR